MAPFANTSIPLLKISTSLLLVRGLTTIRLVYEIKLVGGVDSVACGKAEHRTDAVLQGILINVEG